MKFLTTARTLYHLSGKFLLHLTAGSRAEPFPRERLLREAEELEGLARKIRREIRREIEKSLDSPGKMWYHQ